VQRPPRFRWVLADRDNVRPNLATWAETFAHRIVRQWWLSVLLVIDHPPLYRDYRRRFGVSLHTFRRDKRTIRLTVWYIYAVLHGQWRTCDYIERLSLE
jgi:hypothetical protein